MQDYSTSVDRFAELAGVDVYDQSGDKIGSVAEIFYDDDTRAPEWIGVGTGFFGMKRVLVPVQGATITEDAVTVPYDKSLVKDSPDIDGDAIDDTSERDLYAYYGLADRGPAMGTRSADVADHDQQTGLPNLDQQSVTRSEEELHVGKRDTESGRVRLRKWVETAPVEETVELRRETVHVNREPIAGSVPGEIGEQEIEATLHEERPVVEKEVVARERISLDKDVETRRETVSDDVRRERVEVEGDVDVDVDDNRRR